MCKANRLLRGMEQRPASFLRSDRAGSLVPAKSYQYALLPYERQLIQVLGISEEEYRQFVEEARERCLNSRKGCEHIPDIRMGPVLVPALVSLAVGVVVSGAAALLAPKPKPVGSAKEQDGIEQRTLPSQQGRTKYNNTLGFDAAPSIAQLGSPVPIPFGRYVAPVKGTGDSANSTPASGGMLVEPLLVWSRMFSRGTFQSIKVVGVLGQTPMDTTPSVQAVMLGGTPIDNFHETNFAYFYKGGNGENRLDLDDLVAGDAAPAGNFLAPTSTSDNGEGFCMASTPANATSFGVYQSLPNGSHYRVNWQVLSLPRLNEKNLFKNDPNDRIANARRKVAGTDADGREQGMPGIGRGYALKMGVLGVRRKNGGSFFPGNPEVTQVTRGDIIVYRIKGDTMSRQDAKFSSKSGVTIDDVNSAINSYRERADDLLRLNEIFMINRALFKVIERPSDIWLPGKDYEYKLECIEFTGTNKEIGVAGHFGFDNNIHSEGKDDFRDYFVGMSYYPLHKVDLAQIRNTRATEVTELGIKSQLWGRLNGLCNFNAIPTPAELTAADIDKVNLSTPTMNKYMRRTMFFVLAVKDVEAPQGVDPVTGVDTSEGDAVHEGFDILNNTLFCVQGNAPIDKFNYIRIKHPSKKQYEFKLIPKDSANVSRYKSYESQTVFTLDVSGDTRRTREETVYGPFELMFNAFVEPIDALLTNPEFRSGDATRAFGPVVCTVNEMSQVTPVDANGNTGDLGGGYTMAYYETLLQNLKDVNNPGSGSRAKFDEYRENTFSFTSKGVKITMFLKGFVARNDTEEYIARNDVAKYWAITEARVVSTEGTIVEGETYDHEITISSSSWFAHRFGRSGKMAMRWRASGVSCQQGEPRSDYIRQFEALSQIKELSVYQEVSRSCENGPECEIVYVNESENTATIANYNDLAMLGLKLRTLNSVQSLRQIQVYLKDGISLTRLEDNVYGPTNNFADVAYYCLTQPGRAIAQEISEKLIDKAEFERTAKYIKNHTMRFDGAITTQVNLRSYLTQIAPLFLCSFVIKNGRFALVPALPTNGANEITSSVPITQIFNDGNIVDGSFELEYLDQNEREDFRAVMKYRTMRPNGMPVEESMMVRFNEPGYPGKQEVFDMTNFCTRRSHAFIAARYLLSIRRRVDHVVRFTTTPSNLGLAPGQYIRVETAVSPYDSLYTGAIRQDLSLLSAAALSDGTYTAHIYRAGSEAVVTEQITIENQRVTDSTLANALINVEKIARRFGVYLVEEVGLSEDGLVNVTASHFPVFEDQTSKIVRDVLDPDLFEVLE